MADINGKALAAVSIGVLFVWSGIKGWSILGTVGDLVSGKAPSQANVQPLSNVSGTFSQLPGTSSALDSVAIQYQGHAYRYGGAPGKNAENPWDCSSFVNYCVGVRLGRAIPGYGSGKYTGTVHGPTTGQWAFWSGLARIKREEVVSGDIIVWSGHMGIAINNRQIISALNPKQGTMVTTLEGTGSGPVLTYGRLK